VYRVVDTHAHLSDLEDLRTALERARGAGVCAIIAVSANLKTGLRTLEIAEEYPGYVYPAVGLHPTEIGPDYHEDLMFIEARAGDCVAVGEVGLDFWRRRGEPSKGEEENYTVVDVRYNEEGVMEEMVIQCLRCKSEIRLIGFIELMEA